MARIGPMIARTTEYIILLKIAWSPTVSAIFFTAKSIKTSPIINKTIPAWAGSQNSRASIPPTPPSVFAWLREAMVVARLFMVDNALRENHRSLDRYGRVREKRLIS